MTTTVYIETNCPQCDEEVSLTFDVTLDRQYHPYGSTRVAEDLAEAELVSEAKCPECGAAVDADEEADRAIENAMEQVA